MAKTVVGLMDSYQEAQSVLQDLVNSGFKRESISIMASDKGGKGLQGVEQEGKGEGAQRAEGAAKGAGTGAAVGGIAGLIVGFTGLAIPGIGPIVAAGPLASLLAGAGVGAVAGGAIGALTKMGVPEKDAEYYAEGVKRGGFLVTVTAEDDAAEKAADIMHRHGAVDIDKRAAEWRKEGWAGFEERATTPGTAAQEREGVIPVVEEDVQVGKRQVQTGGVRVYSHLTETPVTEEVRLREERASVERRPVDRPATEAERDAFKERSFEIRETAEEPVVSKQARVKEEVTVGRQTGERTERVQETVRRTDVEVERTGRGQTAAASADDDFFRHFSSTYGRRGQPFDSYRSAYHYAEARSSDPKLQGKDWPEVEEDFQRDWERSHPGTWASYRDAIRYGWDKSHKH